MFTLRLAGALALLLAVGPDTDGKTTEAPVQNPLLLPWTGPHGGVPPFDRVQVEHLKPALEAGMAEQLAEVQAIANDPAAATFENTLAALERSGRTLDRVNRIYGVYGGNLSTPA